METVKACQLVHHIGKYLRYFAAEDEHPKCRTHIAQITMVIPEHHTIVLRKESGAIDEDQGKEFRRFYKNQDHVDVYEEDEAILLAFQDDTGDK